MNFFQFFVKYSIYQPLSADTSFKFLAIILSRYGINKISSPSLSKCRNLTRGDNSGKTRNMCRLFFHEESLHEVSRRYLEHEYTHTHTHTHIHTDKPKPICPPLFQSWRHNQDQGRSLPSHLLPGFVCFVLILGPDIR